MLVHAQVETSSDNDLRVALAREVLTELGVNNFNRARLHQLRGAMDNPASVWFCHPREDKSIIEQAITDLIGLPKPIHANAAKPRKRKRKAKVMDFSKIDCDPRLLDILVNRFPHRPYWRAWRIHQQQGNTDVGPSNGTSYATANAAGVAALWLAHHGATNLAKRAGTMKLQDLFRHELKTSARTPQGWDTKNFGTGIIDALALLKFSWAGGTIAAPSPDTDSEREQAVDLLEPLAREDAAAALANIFRVGEGDWVRNMQG